MCGNAPFYKMQLAPEESAPANNQLRTSTGYEEPLPKKIEETRSREHNTAQQKSNKCNRLRMASSVLRKSMMLGPFRQKNASIFSSALDHQQMAPFSNFASRSRRRRVSKARPARAPKGIAVCCRDMDDLSLVTLGGTGNYPAQKEILKRHIMATDRHGSYDAACEVFSKIEEKNYEWMKVTALPFQISIVAAFSAGIISIPMVFHLPTVEYFNEHFVTAEHPPPKELETSLEVGSWSWNWMEPVLGTSTFILLCLQYMRVHLSHLGIQPYTHRMKSLRGLRLADEFPHYNKDLLIAYSEASPFYNPQKLWI
eukprot:CAMPEP_0119029962 /NCGR_PEP_ID=MMETSP1176-20130426/40791_1 /TAXON_ID=265551 /ORGANISM="Synedropsis recta cf, Strain CCMP1620" /LENGTH=311 /DNA_ID=CAMNT_0006986325 /DNA_START=1 /DNA_END=936 /DNA_ORIENTATION=+